jgi:tetratricopeptide (TPR) repeat protein
MSVKRYPLGLLIIIIFSFPYAFLNCSNMAASAAEYYSIGMAYFDIGKFDEAEKWLNRAKAADRTMTASQYNLGRIAYETKRYEDAAKNFEDILKKDPDNVLALKAAAYTRIKLGDLDTADAHYEKLLSLIPESADDGYNHALVLYAMERYEKSEEVMNKYPFALLENKDVILLYARCQKALNRIEAVDWYARWLNDNKDAKVRFEYAQILEKNELYARASEEYRLAISEAGDNDKIVKRQDIHFALARTLLTADSESNSGVTELQTAVSSGFDDIEEAEKLLKISALSAANKDALRVIINEMQKNIEAKSRIKNETETKKQEEKSDDSNTDNDNNESL